MPETKTKYISRYKSHYHTPPFSFLPLHISAFSDLLFMLVAIIYIIVSKDSSQIDFTFLLFFIVINKLILEGLYLSQYILHVAYSLSLPQALLVLIFFVQTTHTLFSCLATPGIRIMTLSLRLLVFL